MDAKPVSPIEAINLKKTKIPNEVIEAFNEALITNAGSDTIVIYQKDIVALIEKRGLEANTVYQNRWLDIEELYREYGWKVKYDKPCFNETFDAHFIFKPRKGTEQNAR